MDRVGSILSHVDKAAAQMPPTMEQVQENLAVYKKAGEQVGKRLAQLNDILKEIEKNLDAFKVIMGNLEKGSYDIPKITQSAQEGIREVRMGIEDFSRVLKSIQKNYLIRRNLPPEPVGGATDAGLRK